MEPDDIMPNDGTFFTPTEPVEQDVERKEEKARTLQALPIIETILGHLESYVAELNSVTSMPDDVKRDPTKFMNAHNAREMAIDYLTSEKEYVLSLLEAHTKNTR